jgi:hypothetical protein
MAKTAMGISITTVSTDAQAPLGFIHIEPASVTAAAGGLGESHWIYVKNAGAGTITAGEIAKRVAPNYEVDVAVAGDDDVAVGVCQTDIPSGSYGFLLRKGFTTVTGGVGALGNTATTDAAGACAVLGALAVGATGIGNYLGVDLVNVNCRG